MTTRSEALKLHIGTEGPSGGVYGKSSSQNMILYNPLVYQGDAGEVNQSHEGETGAFHFTNWEAKLSSLQVDNKERFEVSGASRYLNYEFGASKIKILDDIAAISYPDYTHINKTVWQHEDGGLYQPWVYGSSSYNKYDNTYFLPLLNHFATLSQGITAELSNLFIVIEYDGYTSSGGTISSGGSTATEVFRFTEDPESTEVGTFYVSPDFGHIRVNSSVSIGGYASYFTDGTNSDARITNSHVTDDVSELETRAYTVGSYTESTGDTVLRIYQEENGDLTSPDYAWGFLGYSKISIIKYTPLVKCGRVDLYTRKSGLVSSFTTNGVITSNNHDLQNHDIVKFSQGLDDVDIDNDINGIKYVQLNDSNSFTIYDDDQFSNKTSLENLNNTDPITWVLIGNTNDASRQGWTFQKSLNSPYGRNGMSELTGSWGTNSNFPTPIRFNGVESYVEIFERDLGFSFSSPNTAPTESNYFSSNMAVRERPSKNDALWIGPQHQVSEYRFGSDIDIVHESGNIYKLLIGEPGPDVIFDWGTEGANLPDWSPYGKAHFITLTKNANKTLSVGVDEIINASSNDSEIDAPREMSDGTGDVVFYWPVATRRDNTSSQTYNHVDQNLFETQFQMTTNYINDDYWYGGMLYHIPSSNRDLQTDNLTFNDIRLGKFKEFIADENIDYPFLITYPNATTDTPFYGYNDNFGKSVSIDKINGEYIAAIGSTVKPTSSPINDVGYVHIYDFTNSTKLQKISGTAHNLQENTWKSFYHKARRFGKCVINKDNNLFIGQSKGEVVLEFISSIDSASFENETSRIFNYYWNGTTYDLRSTIYNPNDYNLFYRGTQENLNHKENFLRGNVPLHTSTSGWLIYLSDRFGDNFVYDNEVLVANSFDNYNDIGLMHDDDSRLFPDSLCDYLNVFEFSGGKNEWIYVDKLSSTIKSTYSKYSYGSVLYPNANKNLRSLGNKTYDNDRLNSITWDIDLTNCYAIADDRIILKDPLGYAIFRRNWNSAANASTIEDDASQEVADEENTYVVADLYPYFKYQEEFLGYESNKKVLHTKLSTMYKYSTTDNMKFYLNSSEEKVEQKTPVYFVSIPEYQIDTLKIVVDFGTAMTSDTQNIKLALYRRDPRINYTIDSDYAYIRNNYEIYSEVPGGLYLADKEADGRYIGRNGAMDAHKYHEYTDISEEPWAKLISGTVESSTTITYYLSISDISYYTQSGSQLQDIIRVFNRGTYSSHLSLDLLDIDKVTYDDTVTIYDTLMFGFIYQQSEAEELYRIPLSTESKDVDLSNTIQNLKITSNLNPPTFTSDDSVTRKIISVYDCINDVVSTYDNITQQTGDDGQLVYTNPVLGLGTSLSATHYDAGVGVDPDNRVIYDGTFSQAYQIMSTDDFYITPGGFVAGVQNEVRSLDIQKLEYLPLLIYSAESKVKNLNLLIDGTYGVNSNIDLFIPSYGATGVLPLHLEQEGISSGIDLYTQGHGVSSGNVNLFIANNFSSGNLDLYLSTTSPASGSLDLYLSSPIPDSGLMPLHIRQSTLDSYKVNSSLNLFTFGNVFTSNILGGDPTTSSASGTDYNNDMFLHISSPGDSGNPALGSGNMPLFISPSIVDNKNNNLSIYLYNNQTSGGAGPVYPGVGDSISPNSINLVIRSSLGGTGGTGSMPLYIHRKGISGGDEEYNNVNLHLENSEISTNLNLYTNSTVGTTGSQDLLIPSGVGSINKYLSNFIRGYEE